MFRVLAFVVLSLIPTLLFAQPKAVISGPSAGNPGDLVVLTSAGSIGDNMVWVIPEKLQVLTCDAQSQLAFASGTPGVFVFQLIVADTNADIDWIKHTVTIGTAPDDPTDPTDPDDPTPAPDLAELTELSKRYAPIDPPTAALIKNFIAQTTTNIAALCAAGQCPTVPVAMGSYQRTIGNALGSRPRGSQSNWMLWRTPIEAKIQEYNPQTIDALSAVMTAVAKGL